MKLPIWRRYGLRAPRGLAFPWRWLREVFYLSSLITALFVILAQNHAIQELLLVIESEQARATRSEYTLRACLNGGYSGIYYFTFSNKRVDFVCDARAQEF